MDVFEGVDKLKVYEHTATECGNPVHRKSCSVCGPSLFPWLPLA